MHLLVQLNPEAPHECVENGIRKIAHITNLVTHHAAFSWAISEKEGQVDQVKLGFLPYVRLCSALQWLSQIALNK